LLAPKGRTVHKNSFCTPQVQSKTVSRFEYYKYCTSKVVGLMLV
jgi:hypothetical protein